MTIPLTETRPSISIPWGQGPPLALEIPDAWNIADVAWPDLSGALDDYPAVLEGALDQPEGGLGLDSLLRPGSTVAIVVDDPTRWTPVREAYRSSWVAFWAPAYARKTSRSASESAAITPWTRRRCVNESATPSRTLIVVSARRLMTSRSTTTWGRRPRGVPVRVFRPVARADLRVLIGSVLPHLQAGFGGGYKLIFPGTSHRSTLGALHRKGLGGDQAGRCWGRTRARTRCVGRSARRRRSWGLASRSATCSARRGRSSHVATGHPDPVQDRLASEASADGSGLPEIDPADRGRRRRRQRPLAGRPDDELQGPAPAPSGRSPRRASWPASSGPIPSEIDRSVPMPALRGIATTGPGREAGRSAEGWPPPTGRLGPSTPPASS